MKVLITSLVSTRLGFSGFLIPPFLSKTEYNWLIQPLLPFGRGIRAFQNFFLLNVKGLLSLIGKKFFTLSFSDN